jgi:beta-phosphoglucomutase-like phosphatase (HAD superfamily)
VTSVMIFDMDGVLVETRGHLKALQETVACFSRAMGVGDDRPIEGKARVFEANGLSTVHKVQAEWPLQVGS